MSVDRHSELLSGAPDAAGADYSCALTGLLLRQIDELGGDVAVESVLRRAGCGRSRQYLEDPSNWISFAESVALWDAATQVTHRRSLARSVGAAAAARSLRRARAGARFARATSAETALAGLAELSARYTRSVTISVRECRPGLLEVVHSPVAAAPRSAHHCDGTVGLFEQAAALLELDAATVEHEICAAFGAPECRYRIVWRAADADPGPEPPPTVGRLRVELEAMRERLNGMFDTAADLVGTRDVADSLERIAARAAQDIGGSRCLLAVRLGAEREPGVLGRGFEPLQLQRFLGSLRTGQPPQLEASWLLAPIRSDSDDYGFLVVEPDAGLRSPSEDRELLEVYARYAAIALDSATARLRAEQRFEQTTALLRFAREVSAAGTSAEVAQRLADSIGLVVECDEVGVHLWDGARFSQLGYRDYRGLRDRPLALPVHWVPGPDQAAARFVDDPQLAPMFLSLHDGRRADRETLRELSLEAAIAVPLAGADRLLGLLLIAVCDRPERLRRTAELTGQIEGVVAQATTTLENGRLMDVVMHQARHDQLTGLANRVKFADDLNQAIARARVGGTLVGLFYMDLDRFKPVNDGFGHDAGDEVLVAVAARLSAHARPGLHVARLGGDEFAVIASAASTTQLERVDREIRELFREPFAIRGRALSLTVSIGRAVFPTDAGDGDGLVRVADAAMYLDKDVLRARRAARPRPD